MSKYFQTCKQFGLYLTKTQVLEKATKSFATTRIRKFTDEKSDAPIAKDAPPQLSGFCCGSGCQNCVWLQYAEELVNYYGRNSKKGSHELRKVLNEIEKLEDENLKAFIKMELDIKIK